MRNMTFMLETLKNIVLFSFFWISVNDDIHVEQFSDSSTTNVYVYF